mgnify:CR=1 FL=1
MKWNKKTADGKLNEEQRKQIAIAQMKQLASQKRLEANLPEFKKEYTSLVNFHKIRHKANLAFVEGTPDWVRLMIIGIVRPTLQLIECAEEIQALNNQAVQMEIDRNKAVDPND